MGIGQGIGQGHGQGGGDDPVGLLLRARGLEGRRAAVVHFCLGPGSSYVGARETSGVTTPLLSFRPLPTRGARLLADIATVDDSARRLLARLGDDLPATVTRLTGIRTDDAEDDAEDGATSALAWLLETAGVILDLDPPHLADGVREGGASLRLDTVVIREGAHLVLDGRRLLRSVVSYRLAGVPGHVLGRSVFESLGNFAADAVRRLLREWPAQLVVCAGDLYEANPTLRGATTRALVGVRLPVILPEAVSPDGPPAPGD